MSPERLQEIRERASEHAATRTTTAYDHGDRLALLGYIDQLHEGLARAWDMGAEMAWDSSHAGRHGDSHYWNNNIPNPYREESK